MLVRVLFSSRWKKKHFFCTSLKLPTLGSIWLFPYGFFLLNNFCLPNASAYAKFMVQFDIFRMDAVDYDANIYFLSRSIQIFFCVCMLKAVLCTQKKTFDSFRWCAVDVFHGCTRSAIMSLMSPVSPAASAAIKTDVYCDFYVWFVIRRIYNPFCMCTRRVLSYWLSNCDKTYIFDTKHLNGGIRRTLCTLFRFFVLNACTYTYVNVARSFGQRC